LAKRSRFDGTIDGAIAMNGLSNKVRLALCAIFLSCQSAAACVVPKLPDHTFGGADVVIRAEVRSYEVVRYLENAGWPENGMERRRPVLAKFEFNVIETITGRPDRSTWSAYYNGGFLKDTWSGPHNVIVGLRARLDDDGTAKVFAMPQLCPASLLSDNPKNLQALKAALAGRPPLRRDDFRLDQ